MQRYEVSFSSSVPPPQYLGGVDNYDVFYWTAAHDGNERLIVKWASSKYCFYYWDFAYACWRDQYSKVPVSEGPSREQTETILAMYQCFAIKPCSA
jgi:hypothetical protein